MLFSMHHNFVILECIFTFSQCSTGIYQTLMGKPNFHRFTILSYSQNWWKFHACANNMVYNS